MDNELKIAKEPRIKIVLNAYELWFWRIAVPVALLLSIFK
jgi:hypothetical protein